MSVQPITPISLWVNGTALDRWTVARGMTYRPPVSVRSTLVEVPGRHGAIPVGLPVYDEPQLTLNLAPASSKDPASLDQMFADLHALLASPSLTVRRGEAGRTEEASARRVSISPTEQYVAGRWARVTVVLALPGVFFRDVAWSTVAVPEGASTHTVLAGSGPITDAVIRWEWAGVTPLAPRSLVDVTSGTGVSVAPTNQNGTYVYVDADILAGWRTNSASLWANPGGSTSEGHNVDYPGPGPLQLWPVARQAEQAMVREVRLQASHPCTIRYRRAWL